MASGRAMGVTGAFATIRTGATLSRSPSTSAATVAAGSVPAIRAGPPSPSVASKVWRVADEDAAGAARQPEAHPAGRHGVGAGREGPDAGAERPLVRPVDGIAEDAVGVAVEPEADLAHVADAVVGDQIVVAGDRDPDEAEGLGPRHAVERVVGDAIARSGHQDARCVAGEGVAAYHSGARVDEDVAAGDETLASARAGVALDGVAERLGQRIGADLRDHLHPVGRSASP